MEQEQTDSLSVAGKFRFDRDTFAFANELVWEYRFDAVRKTMISARNPQASLYTHRCFVLVRSARQFFYHANFAPEQSPADAATYRRLIKEVVARDPRRCCSPSEKILIPGYENLRHFSTEQASLLKECCGGAWQSYLLRSHWRMVFPISRRHQEGTSAQIIRHLRNGSLPIVHLVRFPQLTINHGILLFAAKEKADNIEFQAYDPNMPAHPAEISYDRAARTFHYPKNHYWAGGRVDVIEIYRNWLY